MEKADKVILLYPVDSAPVSVLAVIALVKDQVSVNVAPKKDATTVELNIPSSSTTLKGINSILRYLARKAPRSGLYGRELNDPITSSEIDQWLDSSIEYSTASSLDAVGAELNQHLQMRSVLVGYQITLADVAVWVSLKKNAQWSSFVETNGKNLPHLLRWWSFVENVAEIQEVNQKHFNKADKSSSQKEVKSTGKSTGSFSKLNLPNATEGKVVTRFPPEPSGYLHIGHAKAALMNTYYANHYKGKLILRFDDTNPAKEKDEFVESITQDLKTLGVVPHQVSYTSDFFPQLLQYAEQIIKEGNAFVDTTNVEQMRIERGECVESKCRNNSIEENLRLWEQMKLGSEEGVKCVLRGKIDMKSKNGCLRDPALARCNATTHHRTGTKYKVYPLYDFACPIVDSLEGVTHALRSSEYHDRNPLYAWVCRILRIREPHLEDFSRLNFKYTLLSKRKLQWIVDHGYVNGWNDPRFPTIQGMLRRGLTVEALTEFILLQGASKSLNLMEPEKLWALNKQTIDPIVPRYTAVAAGGRAQLKLINGPAQVENKSIPRHKKNASLGNKVVLFSSTLIIEGEDAKSLTKGEEITLMDWGNCIIDSVNKSAEGDFVIEARLHLEGSVKDTKKKITWLADTENVVKVNLIEYGQLITKEKVEETDNIEDLVNKDSKTETPSVGDGNLRSLSKGDRIQLERRGYFICDEPYLNGTKPIALILIPDGHSTKTASTLITKPNDK